MGLARGGLGPGGLGDQGVFSIFWEQGAISLQKGFLSFAGAETNWVFRGLSGAEIWGPGSPKGIDGPRSKKGFAAGSPAGMPWDRVAAGGAKGLQPALFGPFLARRSLHSPRGRLRGR